MKRKITSCVEGCGSPHLVETNNYYVCRNCGMTYSKAKPVSAPSQTPAATSRETKVGGVAGEQKEEK